MMMMINKPELLLFFFPPTLLLISNQKKIRLNPVATPNTTYKTNTQIMFGYCKQTKKCPMFQSKYQTKEGTETVTEPNMMMIIGLANENEIENEKKNKTRTKSFSFWFGAVYFYSCVLDHITFPKIDV